MKRVSVWLLCVGILCGCKTAMRTNCFSPDDGKRVVFDPDVPLLNERIADPRIAEELRTIVDDSYFPSHRGARTEKLAYLALSGGGKYGAFGVGVLEGWSVRGDRPVFQVVTGISTGALIATYAFLGSEYDELIRDVYVNISNENIFREKPLLRSILTDTSLYDSSPLARLIEQTITTEIVARVAQAHQSGRRLYVGTTHLDTRRLVIWDLGAIAVKGDVELYRRVLLASASVPGFFPPVCFDVEIDGRTYREMHVDGGASSQVFFRWYMLMLKDGNQRSRSGSELFIISSGKIYADPVCVEPKFVKITAAAVSSMLYAATRSDLYRIFSLCLLTGVKFYLMAVPEDFPLDPNSLSFNREQMRRLYEIGFEMGRKGRDAWTTCPPGADEQKISLPRGGRVLQTREPIPYETGHNPASPMRP